ncbi:MAG TPA: NAD(P)H-dependent oxidoreductase [Methylobacter sp.]
MKKILIFPGSQRKQSLNRRLAAHFESLLKQEFCVEILEPDIVDLPLFNQDLENDSRVIERVKQVYECFFNADGLVVVSPEYNGSVSPYLKNTVDWVSRLPRIFVGQGYINPFHGKPMLLASATPGQSGGVLGLQSARNVFSYLGSLILAEQITLPYAAEAWDDDGSLIAPYFNAYLEQTLKRFEIVVKSLPISTQ